MYSNVSQRGVWGPPKQRWSRGHKARGQGQGHKKNPRPRPRTAFPRTDTLEAKDRNARGQGQGPRTQSASALQKKKKKGLHKNFSGDLQKKKKKRSSQKFFKRSSLKNVFQKIFQALHKILSFQKSSKNPKILSFQKKEDRPIFEDLRPRGQGQGLQNVSSRTSSRPRTSSRTPPLRRRLCGSGRKAVFISFWKKKPF